MACPSCAFSTKNMYFNLVQQHVTQQAICMLQLKPSPVFTQELCVCGIPVSFFTEIGGFCQNDFAL